MKVSRRLLSLPLKVMGVICFQFWSLKRKSNAAAVTLHLPSSELHGIKRRSFICVLTLSTHVLSWRSLRNKDQATRRYLYESLVLTVLTLRFCQDKVQFEKGWHLRDLCVWWKSYFKPLWRSGNVKDVLKSRSFGMLMFEARFDHGCLDLELHLNAPFSKK